MSRQRYGLLGWPVKHSVSPQMQGAGFDAIGIEASYELIPVPPDDVPAKVRELVDAGFRGWNITVPHKGAMMRLVDQIDPAARHAESVNTVVNREGTLHGYSTDGYGLQEATREAFDIPLAGQSFVFWGTGGACRATSIHFALQGAAALTLVNRTRAKAEALAATLRAVAPACDIHVLEPHETDAIRHAFAAAAVIYQCTSVGLKPEDPAAIPVQLIPEDARLMDMIYHPTRLLAEAADHGCQTADGRAMLLYQGARSFSLWTGKEAPIDAMRQGLNQALDAGG